MRSFIVIAALAAVGGAPAFAAQVVALGASNTEGKGRGATNMGVPRNLAFPAQLERMLNAAGCKVRVQNSGIAGDTTAGMLRRLPGVLGKDTKVLILQPGGNDARRGDASDTGANIEKITAYAQQRGVKVVMMDRLGSIAPRDSRLADGQHYSEAGHKAFAEYVYSSVRSGVGC